MVPNGSFRDIGPFSVNREPMAKKKIPEKHLPWIEARKRFHLSDAHIQMARELGLNPKKFGGLAKTKQEP
jgi:hypothetical protein